MAVAVAAGVVEVGAEVVDFPAVVVAAFLEAAAVLAVAAHRETGK